MATHPNLHCLIFYPLHPLALRSTAPPFHPKELPFLRASFPSHMNTGCKSLSQQSLAPLICIRCRGHPERLRGPRSAIDRRGQLLSPALSGCLLDRQGKLGPVSSVIYHRNQELCHERGGGRGEGILPGWRMLLPRQSPWFWQGRWNRLSAMAGFPKKLSFNSVFNLRVNVAFMISGEQQR